MAVRTGTFVASPFGSSPFEAGPFAWVDRRLPLGSSAISRVLLIIAIGWLPLAILSALGGVALGPSKHESFLLDFAAYGRYLVAAPLCVVAAALTLPQLADVVRQLVDSGIIVGHDVTRYESLVASTRRAARSFLAAVGLVLVAYLATWLTLQHLYPRDVSTWVFPVTAGRRQQLSLAGWWRTLVSQPLMYSLLGAWCWRLILWARFLRGVSRMDLKLVPAHPDLLGGLRFVLLPLRGLSLLAFALGSITAGSAAETVLVDGVPLFALRYSVGAQALVVLVLLAGPTLFLMRPLVRLQVWGTLYYGRLASNIGHAFQQRWLTKTHETDGDALLSAPDFSATTDLYSIAANVRNINPLVLDLRSIALLAAAYLLPYVPLLFAVMPLEQVLQFTIKALV